MHYFLVFAKMYLWRRFSPPKVSAVNVILQRVAQELEEGKRNVKEKSKGNKEKSEHEERNNEIMQKEKRGTRERKGEERSKL